MIKHVSECVGCEHCVPLCPYRDVTVLVCDECGDEVEKLYWYEGEQLCEDCAVDRFKDELEEIDYDDCCID